jgi:curved DNA-binding protein CbpA
VVERHLTADLYAVLGVNPHASEDEIVRAYRRLALASHPDTRPDDPGASVRFRALTDAYDVLSDPAQRATYDQAHLASTWAGRMRPTESNSSRPARHWPKNPGGHAYGSDPPSPMAPLRAGPVRVEPPTSTRISGHRRVPPTSPFAELAAMLSRYVDELSTGWWA